MKNLIRKIKQNTYDKKYYATTPEKQAKKWEKVFEKMHPESWELYWDNLNSFNFTHSAKAMGMDKETQRAIEFAVRRWANMFIKPMIIRLANLALMGVSKNPQSGNKYKQKSTKESNNATRT